MLEPEMYMTWKREKASQAIPGEVRRVPILAENNAVATVYPGSFRGEEFFCPLGKQQTFVFTGNTKTPQLNNSGTCRTLNPTTGDFLCRKVVSSTWGNDRTSLKAGQLIFVISFTTYDFCSQTTANFTRGALITGKAYLFLQKDIHLLPALETAEHTLA